MRPSWDSYFYDITKLVALRSTCVARKVGCLLVIDNIIISTGYNGSPPGHPHCDDVGCNLRDGRCIRTTHAEQNAIVQCALKNVSPKGSTLYITCRPCMVCANLIITAGIKRIVCPKIEDDSWKLLESSSIELCSIID